MGTDDIIHKITELVRQAEEKGYSRGLKDGVDRAKAQILAAVSAPEDGALAAAKADDISRPSPPAPTQTQSAQRKRAPKGLPRALVMRVLRNKPDGVTPQEIADAADTEFERMIAISSIRGELRKGQEQGRYLEVDGLWLFAKETEAEDQDLDVQSSASPNSNNGGISNAAALD